MKTRSNDIKSTNGDAEDDVEEESEEENVCGNVLEFEDSQDDLNDEELAMTQPISDADNSAIFAVVSQPRSQDKVPNIQIVQQKKIKNKIPKKRKAVQLLVDAPSSRKQKENEKPVADEVNVGSGVVLEMDVPNKDPTEETLADTCK